MLSDFGQFLISDPMLKGMKNSSIEKTEEFLPAEKFQERGMIGNTGFSGICSGPKPLAIMDDGLFEYSKKYGSKKLEQ
jgi:hypothetical protein